MPEGADEWHAWSGKGLDYTRVAMDMTDDECDTTREFANGNWKSSDFFIGASLALALSVVSTMILRCRSQKASP